MAFEMPELWPVVKRTGRIVLVLYPKRPRHNLSTPSSSLAGASDTALADEFVAENSWTTGRRGLHKKPAEQNQQVEERHKTPIKRVKPALRELIYNPRVSTRGE